MDTIAKFARDTRHKEHELDNVQLISKKLLATQTPISTCKDVYPYVSSDRSRIEFRCPGTLENYTIEPGFLSQVLVQSSVDLSKYAIVNDFVGKVQPETGKELVTFFLHGQRDNDLHAFIDADLGLDQDAQLYTKIRNYTPDAALSKQEVTREIGALINALTIDIAKDEQLFIDCGMKESSEESEEEEKEEKESRLMLEDVESKEWTADHERALRENPVMRAFKKDVKLTTQFPAVKTSKQLILSVVASPVNIALYIHPLLGKRQNTPKKNTTVDLGDESHWKQMLNIVDSFKQEAIDAIIDTEQAKSYGLLSKFTGTKHEFVKSLINAHSPFTSDSKSMIRYLKRYPNGLSSEIVQQIVQG